MPGQVISPEPDPRLRVINKHGGGQRSTGRRFRSLLSVGLAVAGAFTIGVPTATSAACDALGVPAVNLERCVVPGDQAEIDAGNVVRMTGLSSSTVHWLAGHRTSHGGTFGSLIGLEVGDYVVYGNQSYRVVEYTVVAYAQTAGIQSWVDTPNPTVVLQTSKDDFHAHLWRAELDPTAPIASQPAPTPAPVVAEPPTLIMNEFADAAPSRWMIRVRLVGSAQTPTKMSAASSGPGVSTHRHAFTTRSAHTATTACRHL